MCTTSFVNRLREHKALRKFTHRIDLTTTVGTLFLKKNSPKEVRCVSAKDFRSILVRNVE